MKINMKVYSLEQEGKCLAQLSATLDGCFAVRGLRLMEGKNGLFLNFPSYKGRSGYVDICFPTTAELRQQMTGTAVAMRSSAATAGYTLAGGRGLRKSPPLSVIWSVTAP